MKKKVTVFGGANYNENHEIYKLAYDFGRYLGAQGYTIINGGYGGVMEGVSKGAFEAGAHTIGVTFEYLTFPPNPYIKEEIKMPELLSRTKKLIDLADMFVAFPGGTGTLLEISMVLEFLNKRVIEPKVLYLVTDYWKPVIDTMKPELRFIDPRFEWGKKRDGLMNYIKFIYRPEELK